MEKIRGGIKSFCDNDNERIRECDVDSIRQSNGFQVNTFRELVKRVAELSFHNPGYNLFFRGQKTDFKSHGITTLLPSIFRDRVPIIDDDNYNLRKRFEILEYAEEVFRDYYHREGEIKFRRYEILRWAVIQHYEIFATPLLDVTHSLRVACCFAQIDSNNTKESEESFLYVLGMPQVSGGVTASSEQGIQIIRLLSVCPPTALRPHFQEGYLIGDFPNISNYEEKMQYDRSEVDFGQRLICKFRLGVDKFWDDIYASLPPEALLPQATEDPLKQISNRIIKQLQKNFRKRSNT